MDNIELKFMDKIDRESFEGKDSVRWRKYSWQKFSTSMKPSKQFKYAYPKEYTEELNKFFDEIHPY